MKENPKLEQQLAILDMAIRYDEIALRCLIGGYVDLAKKYRDIAHQIRGTVS